GGAAVSRARNGTGRRQNADQRDPGEPASAAAFVWTSSRVHRTGASGCPVGGARSRVEVVSVDRCRNARISTGERGVVVRPSFLEELDRRVLVCDGAMGTML